MTFNVQLIVSAAARPLRLAQVWIQQKRDARAVAAQHYDPVPAATRGCLMSMLTSVR